ncbi:MAG: SPOCS domain-containing protein [Huintestinicola sp.]
MNIKVNKEIIRSPYCVCSAAQEQSVELDYVLPDYCPEIFRIIKCMSSPEITSAAVSGNKLTYELTVCLRVIYCTEGSSVPQAVDQKLTYSRTVNLEKECVSPEISLHAHTDHINCRAVNRRRIDIRGAVTIHIRVMGETETEAVCDAFGGNLQLKKLSARCPVSVIRCSRRAEISDEFELSEGKPPIGTILRCRAESMSVDKKIVANKFAAKGELKISILYTPAAGYEDECAKVQTMQFTLPYSRLIDMDGLDDRYSVRLTAEVISCEVTPRSSEGDGESRSLECEVMMLFNCTAARISACDIASDEYSTRYATEHASASVRIPCEPVPVDCSCSVKGICGGKEMPLSTVYDAWCSSSKLRASVSNGRVTVSGNAVLSVIGETTEGDCVICETEVPVEADAAQESGIDLANISELAEADLTYPVLSAGYTLTSENTAEVKAEIAIRGFISDYTSVNVITDITVDETSETADDSGCAVRLYFAEAGEELWDIAKRYRASMAAVAEENDLDSDSIKESTMLLIPIS